jgi:hypothetical protein
MHMITVCCINAHTRISHAAILAFMSINYPKFKYNPVCDTSERAENQMFDTIKKIVFVNVSTFH